MYRQTVWACAQAVLVYLLKEAFIDQYARPRGRRFHLDGALMTSDIVISIVAFFFFLPGLFLLAGIFDVLTGRIPDWISIALVVVFVGLSLIVGKAWMDFGLHCAVAIAVFFAGFIAFAMGWMGGGDGRLAAAGALWFGPALTFEFLAIAFFYGAAMVGMMYVVRLCPIPAPILRQPWVERWVVGNDGLPFGLAMAASVLTLRSWMPSVPVF